MTPQDSDEEEEYGEQTSVPITCFVNCHRDTDTSPALSTATGDTDTSAAFYQLPQGIQTHHLLCQNLNYHRGYRHITCFVNCHRGYRHISCRHGEEENKQGRVYCLLSALRTHGLVMQFQRLTTFYGPSSWRNLYNWLTPSRPRSKRVQPATVQPVQQERADYGAARRLQTLNYSSYPGGYLPIWQQQYQVYQPPPRAMLPPPPATLAWACHIQPHCQRQQHRQRSQLHPVWTLLVLRTALSRLRIQTYNVSTGGQTDPLRELMKFSGIPTIDASCDSDIHEV
ncbi:unnamed protein product [Mytilus coruscus]|uniref:Uncharacterized protein n=1 Tax=Mytilus coruscus TaxID=42192 RepID=A0A6J8CGG3_MYTCO|nr:unnamed protein product [Mytilus coruscus]